MTETGETLADARVQTRPPAPAEPATSRALWPTFMRRTLAEDIVRPENPPAAE